jgi:hypothetical protein
MYPNTNISRCLVLNHDNRYNSLTPTLFIEMSVPSQDNESVMSVPSQDNESVMSVPSQDNESVMSVPSQDNESVMYLCIKGLGFGSFYDFGI